MVKSKKNKADKSDPDGMSTNSTDEVEHVKQAAALKQSIALKSESDDDEVQHPVKAAANKTKKAKGKPKVQEDSDNDDDEDESRGATKVGKQTRPGGFASLMMDEDDYNSDDAELDNDENEEEDIETKVKPQKSAKNEKKTKQAPMKEGKKKGNNKDDIDKILLELEISKAGDAKPDLSEDSGAKTAAQKKKEKKERQKREAAMQKEQPKEAPVAEKEKPEKKVEPEPPAETAVSNETVDVESTEVTSTEDKKKKKKDKNEKTAKAKNEEEKEKSRKGPSKNVVAAMQEHLKKMKEEEERLRKEEEEKIQLLEEAENLRLEQLRLEQEKKEKRKQKEKERKERLKAEGKLLSNKQKLDKLRAQAMLEALKAQGLDIPEVGEKRPRPGTRIRNNKKSQAPNSLETQISTDKTDEADSSTKDEIADENDTPAVEKVDDVKEAWDASSSSEDEENDEDATDEVSNLENKLQATEINKKSREGKPSESESVDAENETDDSSGDENMNEDERKQDAEYRRQRVVERIQKRRRDAEANRTLDKLRAAVVCVLGHVDTGKTKILDKLRRTNVQDGEAGGITQQIGATNVPIDVIKEQTKIVKNFSDMSFKLPGLLIIDTPGHESFSNLRNRGSSLCDIAILVVDIMHGLEPQTIESINLLKSRKTPFIVALNKIDRLYDWQTMGKKDVRDIIKSQQANTLLEFEQRSKKIITEFAEQGLNAALFYENPDTRSYVSLVPTSAITGEGMGNLLFLIIESCQNLLAKRLMYSEDLLATVLEVKAIPGLGTTIDAILINGRLREGDTMIVAGTDGPIVTQIRSLLMPQPMKELRVKNAYIEHKEIMAAQGVKIAAKELEKAIAGLNMQIAQKQDEVEILKEEVAKELKSALNSIKLSALGVYVQASTLGSLEALLEFLKASKIPYSGIRIGPVVKRDVMKASTMLTHVSQYATILAFDVKIERDAQELADSLGVKIFQADIIYHLFDKFTAYCDELKQKKRDEFKSIAVFPCKLKILPQFVFNSRDPIVMGVIIEAGILKEGTPICVPTKEFVELGIITSIESNHKQIPTARKGQEVCIKIEPLPGEAPKMFGRHFDDTDFLVSKITRQSIDACKEYFRDDLVKTDWALMVELKKQFQIL